MHAMFISNAHQLHDESCTICLFRRWFLLFVPIDLMNIMCKQIMTGTASTVYIHPSRARSLCFAILLHFNSIQTKSHQIEQQDREGEEDRETELTNYIEIVKRMCLWSWIAFQAANLVWNLFFSWIEIVQTNLKRWFHLHSNDHPVACTWADSVLFRSFFLCVWLQLSFVSSLNCVYLKLAINGSVLMTLEFHMHQVAKYVLWRRK